MSFLRPHMLLYLLYLSHQVSALRQQKTCERLLISRSVRSASAREVFGVFLFFPEHLEPMEFTSFSEV